jgi:hypothetical protein
LGNRVYYRVDAVRNWLEARERHPKKGQRQWPRSERR